MDLGEMADQGDNEQPVIQGDVPKETCPDVKTKGDGHGAQHEKDDTKCVDAMDLGSQ